MRSLRYNHKRCDVSEKEFERRHTMTGKITSTILVAKHLRVRFCRKEWLMDHVSTQINEIVVMYLSVEKVIRPEVPPDVSICKGIMS